jgi:hypothetical protein
MAKKKAAKKEVSVREARIRAWTEVKGYGPLPGHEIEVLYDPPKDEVKQLEKDPASLVAEMYLK